MGWVGVGGHPLGECYTTAKETIVETQTAQRNRILMLLYMEQLGPLHEWAAPPTRHSAALRRG